MTHTWTDKSAITVRTDSAERPIMLHWSGAPHRVQQLVETWEIHTNWWESGGAIRRIYHALITADGIFCIIYLDLDTTTWHLARIYD